jgi:hypothetical protein
MKSKPEKKAPPKEKKPKKELTVEELKEMYDVYHKIQKEWEIKQKNGQINLKMTEEVLKKANKFIKSLSKFQNETLTNPNIDQALKEKNLKYLEDYFKG